MPSSSGTPRGKSTKQPAVKEPRSASASRTAKRARNQPGLVDAFNKARATIEREYAELEVERLEQVDAEGSHGATSVCAAFAEAVTPVSSTGAEAVAPASSSGAEAVAPASGSLAELSADEAASLRAFDLMLQYGPCVGLSRLERWHRAGQHPPAHFFCLLLFTFAFYFTQGAPPHIAFVIAFVVCNRASQPESSCRDQRAVGQGWARQRFHAEQAQSTIGS